MRKKQQRRTNVNTTGYARRKLIYLANCYREISQLRTRVDTGLLLSKIDAFAFLSSSVIVRAFNVFLSAGSIARTNTRLKQDYELVNR